MARARLFGSGRMWEGCGGAGGGKVFLACSWFFEGDHRKWANNHLTHPWSPRRARQVCEFLSPLMFCITIGKLEVKGLRRHTMRHFAVANLHRLNSVHTSCCNNLERLVEKHMQRVVGEPAGGELDMIKVSLTDIVEVLFKPDAAHHQRTNGKVSQRLQDLQKLCLIYNDCLLRDKPMHRCKLDSFGKPCCSSEPCCTCCCF